MKRLGVLLTLVLLASAASAQIVRPNTNPFGSGTEVPGCTSSILTASASSLLNCNPASVVNGSLTSAGRATLTIRDTMATASDQFLNISGTFADVAGSLYGIKYDLATPVSATPATIIGEYINLNAGYTGGSSRGLLVNNLVAGTGTALNISNAGANIAAQASTVGANTGIQGEARGSSTINIGHFARADSSQNTPPLNVGTYSRALNATVNVGGYFTLDATNTAPTLTSAAVIANNSTQTSNILDLRDNGTTIQAVQDGGSLYSKMGTKALTLGGGAVTFVRVAVTSGSFQGGFIDWCADANDAADFQTRCGILPFSIVNKAGTETCTVGTPGTATESVAASAGTFTVAFTVDTATPTNGCDFQANGTSSLTETVMRINYTVRLVGNAATAVTAQ